VAPEELAEPVTAALFRHSTTAGGPSLGWRSGATLARRQVTVQLTPEVTVRVKVLEHPDAEGGESQAGVRRCFSAAARALWPARRFEVARVAQRDAEALVAKSKE